MATAKKIYEREGKKVENAKGQFAYELKEAVGAISELIILKESEIKELVERSQLQHPARVLEFLKQPNVALIRLIQAGWSINENYYDSKVLKELVSFVTEQGRIQFSNHVEGTKLDRKWEEFVSYSKFVWFDDKTDAVYAAVKFPREKQDTGWILNLIQEDPEIVGVSIAAAVYITEDYKDGGKTGDKVDGWAYFDSADYVLWPSAGGQAIEASDVQEKIKEAKESMAGNKKKYWKVGKESKEIKEKIEQLERIVEQNNSFLSKFYSTEAYHIIQAVTDALYGFLIDTLYATYDEDYSYEEKMGLVEKAMGQALEVISNLEFFKNPGAQYDENGNVIKKESEKPLNNLKLKNKEHVMKLAELKEKQPEVYAELMTEATASAKAELEQQYAPKLQAESAKVIDLTGKLETANRDLDVFKTAEAIMAKKVKVSTLLTEEKLDDKHVTAQFRKTLESIEDEGEIRAEIKDRKQLVDSLSSTTVIKQEGEDLKLAADKLQVEISPELLKSAAFSILR